MLSEDISVFEWDGAPVGVVRANIDAACSGAKGTPPTSGSSRVLCAAGTRDDRWYVCLAGLPVIGPAYIAVLDPFTGRRIKRIAAETPNTPERVSKYDGTGTIYPLDGAVEDRTVILDRKVEF